MIRQIVGADVNGVKNIDAYPYGELKYNGSKYFLHIKNGKAYGLTSKRISVKSNQLNEKIDNFPKIKDVVFPFKKETIIVVEIIAEHLKIPQGKICGYVSGIMNSRSDNENIQNHKLVMLAHSFLYYEGKDVRESSLGSKYNTLKKYFPTAGKFGEKIYLKTLNPIYSVEKLSVYDVVRFIKNKYNKEVFPKWSAVENYIKNNEFEFEGFVVKDYSSNDMCKIVTEKNCDAIIVDFNYDSKGKYKLNNWIKSVNVAVFSKGNRSKKNRLSKKEINKYLANGDLVVIASLSSGMDERERGIISENSELYLGKIVKCRFKEWSGNKLIHPRWDSIRNDQNLSRCTLSQFSGI